MEMELDVPSTFLRNKAKISCGIRQSNCVYVCGTVSMKNPIESTQSHVYTYCLSRKNDYENFLCTLLLPHSIKSAAFAVRAFNVEVAQVEDQVSDSRIGAMRLQFWADALNKIYDDNPPRNPVVLELHRVDK